MQYQSNSFPDLPKGMFTQSLNLAVRTLKKEFFSNCETLIYWSVKFNGLSPWGSNKGIIIEQNKSLGES